MPKAVLLTGGNLGDIRRNIELVRNDIENLIGNITVMSKVYESEPWGFESDNIFLNQIVIAETELEPEELLDKIHIIEERYGRLRNPLAKGYQSRTMDIDIIFYDDLVIDTPKLRIPHPFIAERVFVMEPLNEIIPNYVHPVYNMTINSIKNLKNSGNSNNINYICRP